MAVKHKKQQGVLVCSANANKLVIKEQKPKTPYVRIFGKLTPIKESEIPIYEGFTIEYL